MSDTTARTLRLLSFLQRRHYWPGEELAALRRDIERLRELGYTVESNRGTDGGYRLGSSTGDAMLLLDNDEATALAAALHQAASGTSELAEASLGALTKVLTMLGPAQRHRAETVRSTTAFGVPSDPNPPQLATLNTVASACRDHVALSFDYLAANATASSRYVEPCRLVALDTRWYLVAYDRDRADWRTFRIDRISNPIPARNTFTPRPAPASNLSEYVRFNMSEPKPQHIVVVEIDVPGDDIRTAYGTWVDVEDLPGGRCQLTMTTDSFVWPTHIVTNLNAPYNVVTPPRFQQHLLAIAQQIRGCVPDPSPGASGYYGKAVSAARGSGMVSGATATSTA
jgi:predicted DNA-binding transcriptional regulator YafY